MNLMGEDYNNIQSTIKTSLRDLSLKLASLPLYPTQSEFPPNYLSPFISVFLSWPFYIIETIPSVRDSFFTLTQAPFYPPQHNALNTIRFLLNIIATFNCLFGGNSDPSDSSLSRFFHSALVITEPNFSVVQHYSSVSIPASSSCTVTPHLDARTLSSTEVNVTCAIICSQRCQRDKLPWTGRMSWMQSF